MHKTLTTIILTLAATLAIAEPAQAVTFNPAVTIDTTQVEDLRHLPRWVCPATDVTTCE